MRRIVERERLREERLREIVDRFKVTVILFGSRARGGSTPASDYDLLIIYDDPAELEKLLSSFKDARIPVDVHAFTLEDALNTMPTSTIILDALEEGAVLKES
ncbi:MAG: nucleotidyltransferase domain-containing protein, partial [Candidatus Korarchaeota archaeon NZ13-K]